MTPPERRPHGQNCPRLPGERGGASSWRVVSDPATDPRRILAMGGGGFTMQERSPALDRLVLSLTGKAVPKICFLPTASGDPREQTTRFYERFAGWPCEPSILSLFHLARDRIDPCPHLLAQDAIYVGGGSMRNMLAIWREHGVDAAMRQAWESGVVLAGLSAGAMCWFAGGVTMSGGAPASVAGLGLLEGSLSVHLDSEPERLPVFREAVATGRLEPGYAADDGAALVFAGQRLQSLRDLQPGFARAADPARRQRVGQPCRRCRSRSSQTPARRARCNLSPTASQSCGRCGPGVIAGTDQGAGWAACRRRRTISPPATSTAAAARPITIGSVRTAAAVAAEPRSGPGRP